MKEFRTEYVVDRCEYPKDCDMPECSCERLFTSKYVKELWDKIHKLEEN